MNKVIALDLGRVCVNINPQACQKALGIVSSNSIKKYTDLYVALETGTMDSHDFVENLRKISQKQLSVEDILLAFCSIICGEISGISEIVCRLASKGYKICLFSDTSRLHLYESLTKLSFAHLIIGGVYSFEIGAFKPGIKMFMEFEKRYGKPILYIDDKKTNCTEAEKYGWGTHCFISVNDLDNVVKAL